jgi:hypothetical protein
VQVQLTFLKVSHFLDKLQKHSIFNIFLFIKIQFSAKLLIIIPLLHSLSSTAMLWGKMELIPSSLGIEAPVRVYLMGTPYLISSWASLFCGNHSLLKIALCGFDW